tara:strand:- start:998 stop:1177 length:180 start_codon:yes stop_codon:yes gene_type:complete
MRIFMIDNSTYIDLRLLLDTLEGMPYDRKEDIEYREAVRLLVESYEKQEGICAENLPIN